MSIMYFIVYIIDVNFILPTLEMPTGLISIKKIINKKKTAGKENKCYILSKLFIMQKES